LDPRHLTLAESAVALASQLVPDDAGARARLLFEVALAAQLAGETDGVPEKYEHVCQAPSSTTGRPADASADQWCRLAGLKIAMMGTDADAVVDAAKAVLGAVAGAPEIRPEEIVARLIQAAATLDTRMLVAEALSDLAVVRYESDRKFALEAIGAAFDVLTAGTLDLDVTVASHVVSAALLVIPQPWDSDAEQFDAVPVARRALKLAEAAFGADNPRIWDALTQLQFQVWNSRFAILASTLKDDPRQGKVEEQVQPKLDDWNPLFQRPLMTLPAPLPDHLDKSLTADVDNESKLLIDRLYALALHERNERRQEVRLEQLASSVSELDDMDELHRQILTKRASLIEEGVAHNRLPLAMKLQASVTLAEIDLAHTNTRNAAVARIENVSEELAQLDDGSEDLGRALLAVIRARIHLIAIDESTQVVQLPKATSLLMRAKDVVANNRSRAGISEIDLIALSRRLDELRSK
jgi:hypothetical protein